LPPHKVLQVPRRWAPCQHPLAVTGQLPDGHQVGNVTRRRTVPPFGSSDLLRPRVTDAVVAEWVHAHHMDCSAEWLQSQEAAGAAADIVAQIQHSKMSTVAEADSLSGIATVAA